MRLYLGATDAVLGLFATLFLARYFPRDENVTALMVALGLLSVWGIRIAIAEVFRRGNKAK